MPLSRRGGIKESHAFQMIEDPSSSGSPAACPDTAQADASCRVPLFVLFGGSVFWAVIASALALIASIKFHSPSFLADCSWLTYGRVRAAAADAQLYGFALQAGFGAALWIIARIGAGAVSQPWLIGAGGKLWNIGVLAGVIGILAGDSTGFENFEMPRYAGVVLFVAYVMIGLWTALTLHNRKEGRLGPSQWFFLAALFWFPWIDTTAVLLLQVFRVRGVEQSLIDWWGSNNLLFVWMSLTGIGAVFYLVPKFAGRSLHSQPLALFAFWTLILFGSWAGVPAGAPVPAWIPALSAVAAVLTAVPLLAVAVNVRRTLEGQCSRLAATPASLFIGFGTAAWVIAGAMRIAGAVPVISPFTSLTWFGVAQSELNSCGFFAMILFGTIYYSLPRVTGVEWPSSGSVRAHFWLGSTGIVLAAAPLAVGGILQGLKLNDEHVAFAELTKSTLPFLRASTTGDLLMLIGNLLLAVNVFRLWVRFGRARLAPFCAALAGGLRPAEEKP